MDWTALGHILTGVLAVTTIIATALVGLMFGSLRTLRDTANDLRARVGDLETERTEDKARIVKTEAEKETTEAENKTLKGLVTGAVNWTVLNDQLSHHHEAAEQHWGRVEDLLHTLSRGNA